jgi:hypothetical protein
MVEFEALYYSSGRSRLKFINYSSGHTNHTVAECYVSFSVWNALFWLAARCCFLTCCGRWVTSIFTDLH